MLRSIDDLLQEPELPVTQLPKESQFEQQLLFPEGVVRNTLFTQVSLSNVDFDNNEGPNQQVRLLFINKKTYLDKPEVVKNLAPIVFVAEYNPLYNDILMTGLKADPAQRLLALCRYNFVILPAFIRASYRLGIYGVKLRLTSTYCWRRVVKPGQLLISSLHLVSVLVLGKIYSPDSTRSSVEELKVYMQHNTFYNTYMKIADACTAWELEVADVN